MASTRPKVFTPKPVETIQTITVEDPILSEPEELTGFHDEFPILGNLNLPAVIEESYVTIEVRLPKTIYDDYCVIATRSELTPADLMQHRLVNCKNHNAVRGLWFSDADRAQLESLTQKWPLESASQALKLLAKSGILKIDGEEIILTPAQKRVLSLAMYGGRTPKTFFEAMIKKELRT